MVSTTAGGRPLKSAASRPGATHGGSTDLDVGAIWCRAAERGGPPYMSLLIIPCIIYYVTNKETLNLSQRNAPGRCCCVED